MQRLCFTLKRHSCFGSAYIIQETRREAAGVDRPPGSQPLPETKESLRLVRSQYHHKKNYQIRTDEIVKLNATIA